MATAAELVRLGYDAMSRGDFAAVLALLDPEVVMHDRPESPDAATYHGHEGALEALHQTLDYFDGLEMVPEQVHEAGDFVVVVVLMRGRGRESEVPVEERIAHLWRVKDERIVGLRAFSEPAQALAAAGIAAG